MKKQVGVTVNSGRLVAGQGSTVRIAISRALGRASAAGFLDLRKGDRAVVVIIRLEDTL